MNIFKILKNSTSLRHLKTESINGKYFADYMNAKTFTTTSVKRLKEVQVTTEGNNTVVEGKYVDEGGNKYLPTSEGCEEYCPVCPHRLGVELKYTDVLVLSQFLRPDGCLLPRYATGVCASGQRRLKTLVQWSQRAGLMPELRPELKSGRDWSRTKSRYKWRQFNIYYDKYGDVH